MQRKIISNLKLSIRYTFSSFDEIRKDLEFCTSLGIVNSRERDCLLWYIKGTPLVRMDGVVTRLELFNKLKAKLAVLLSYNLIPESMYNDLMFIIRKVYNA